MTKSAKDGRWAIVPPPSSESQHIAEDLRVDPEAGKLGAARRRKKQAQRSQGTTERARTSTRRRLDGEAESPHSGVRTQASPPPSESMAPMNFAGPASGIGAIRNDEERSKHTIPAAPESHQQGYDSQEPESRRRDTEPAQAKVEVDTLAPLSELERPESAPPSSSRSLQAAALLTGSRPLRPRSVDPESLNPGSLRPLFESPDDD